MKIIRSGLFRGVWEISGGMLGIKLSGIVTYQHCVELMQEVHAQHKPYYSALVNYRGAVLAFDGIEHKSVFEQISIASLCTTSQLPAFAAISAQRANDGNIRRNFTECDPALAWLLRQQQDAPPWMLELAELLA